MAAIKGATSTLNTKYSTAELQMHVHYTRLTVDRTTLVIPYFNAFDMSALTANGMSRVYRSNL